MKPLPVHGEVRAWIAAHWREETDQETANRFGVSRQYVMTARKRMGLVKDLALISEIRTEVLSRIKKKKERVRRLSTSLRARVVRGELLSEEEQKEYMRSMGYVV